MRKLSNWIGSLPKRSFLGLPASLLYSKSTTKRCDMRTGYVYFIAYNDEELRKYHPVIKIGMTYDIDRRLKNLSTASAIPLILAGFIPSAHPKLIEDRLHIQFSKRRLNGEWFQVDKSMLEELHQLEILSSKIDQLFELDDNLEEIELMRIKIKRMEKAIKRRDEKIKELCACIKRLDPISYSVIANRLSV